MGASDSEVICIERPACEDENSNALGSLTKPWPAGPGEALFMEFRSNEADHFLSTVPDPFDHPIIALYRHSHI